MATKGSKTKVASDKDAIIAAIPLACTDERAAVEFMEQQRWGDKPTCPRCGHDRVYKMVDAKTGERNRRFLWRCHGCKQQFTVRIGTVMEESRIPLKHWCYAFWRACTSKKGVAALEIKRHTGLTYTSALYLMHRIRLAMKPEHVAPMTGDIEADETYCGGKTRSGIQGKTDKTPVLALVQREGQVRAKVVQRVTAANLRQHIDRNVDKTRAVLHTDESNKYRYVGPEFAGGHQTVNHSEKEYYRHSDASGVNNAESFFCLIKRGLMGIYHSVSTRHLHRYVNEYEFRWNTRGGSDGKRVAAAIRGAEGKRLTYRPLTSR